MRLTLRYFEGCPNRLVAHARLIKAAREAGIPTQIALQRVTTQVEAERLRFVGSPTFLIDGHDLFASSGHSFGLTCRMYETPGGLAGSPTKKQLALALQREMNHSSSSDSRLPKLGRRKGNSPPSEKHAPEP